MIRKPVRASFAEVEGLSGTRIERLVIGSMEPVAVENLPAPFALLFRLLFLWSRYLQFGRFQVEYRLVVAIKCDQVNENFARGDAQGRDANVILRIAVLETFVR